MLQTIREERMTRARLIRDAGGLNSAIESGSLAQYIDLSLSEAIVLGLIQQDVKNFVGIFGHGSTEVAEVLRVYEAEGLVKMYPVRNEIEAVHAATALRWVTAEKCAVVTSIGPGAMQAFAGSLVPLSEGLGVWFLIGDETTEDEGPNMQQIPSHEQDQFLKLFSVMGPTYKLHTPGAINTALTRGLVTTEHPIRQSPFYLLMPMNTQPEIIPDFNLKSFPADYPPKLGAAADNGTYLQVAEALLKSERIVVKVGGGTIKAGAELLEFLELTDAVAVTSPLVPGLVPYSNPRNMMVGGSKGTICGNYAMENADLLVAIGTRFVCQSDCSRTGYPNVKKVITINGDVNTALHYRKTTALVGDIQATLSGLNAVLREKATDQNDQSSRWLQDCSKKRQDWEAFKQARYSSPCLYDEMWKKEVLTQPAAIKAALDWARDNQVVSFFDAGDVQANGFQIVENERYGQTFTETGASYMGFASSALLATAMTKQPFYGLAFTGDGSFVMNPQILIDAVQHRASGCILLMDNRRMAAISGLQKDQYKEAYATNDSVEVDYVAWGNAIKGVRAGDGGFSVESLLEALNNARKHKGLSLVYIRVYSGDDPLGGMGVFGRWNVGNWSKETQALRHKIGL
ncbi:thiamine pyrophosphate-binding protein [bacterium]|nr:thiamine pyrophosphate-binding protein [bacterium]